MAMESDETPSLNAAAVAAPAAPAAGQVWMPVKHAARATGVPERTAFRWAKKGLVPVQRSGKVQLVELGALRAYALRPSNASIAAQAAPVATVAGSSRLDEVARIADWDERLCALEDALEEIYERVMGNVRTS